MAVNPKLLWLVTAAAWARLQEDECPAVLIGSAALAALGVLPATEVEDVDFLCERMPNHGVEFSAPREYRDQSRSREATILGVRVNYILAGDERAPFIDPEPAHPLAGFETVAVARVEYVLTLKARANRHKDRAFFLAHPDIALYIDWKDPGFAEVD